LLREQTSVSDQWNAELAMGHKRALSRLIGGFNKDKSHMKKLKEIKEMLK